MSREDHTGLPKSNAVEAPPDRVASFRALLEELRRSPEFQQLPFAQRLRRLRKAREWSHQQLARRMVIVGRNHRGQTASAASLKTMQSRWENEDRLPDERNRRLLAETLGIEVADLGLTQDPDMIW